PFRNQAGNLNEILFENRNQNYGAYVIRKSYNTTVLKSLGITAGAFILGFWIISLIVNTEPELISIEAINITPDVVIPIELTKKPIVEPQKPQPKVPSKPVAQNSIGTKIIDSTEKTVNTNLAVNIQTTGTNSLNITPTDPGTSTLSIEPTNTLTANNNGAIEIAPDVLPSMPDWPKILRENLTYPNEARMAGISGKVVINFIIDEEGKIIQTKILKHVAGGCDEEALRVIKLMPKWNPGKMGGKPVKVSFNQVINFQMQ
ncbi:MAG: energy transducer TonB, partial [Bacteroidia bacterium]